MENQNKYMNIENVVMRQARDSHSNKEMLKQKVENEKIKIMKFYDAYYNVIISPNNQFRGSTPPQVRKSRNQCRKTKFRSQISSRQTSPSQNSRPQSQITFPPSILTLPLLNSKNLNTPFLSTSSNSTPSASKLIKQEMTCFIPHN